MNRREHYYHKSCIDWLCLRQSVETAQMVTSPRGSSINDVMLFWGIFYSPPPLSCFFMHPLTLLVMRTRTPPPSGMTSFMDDP